MPFPNPAERLCPAGSNYARVPWCFLLLDDHLPVRRDVAVGLAAADAFDAMTADRHYRQALSLAEAAGIDSSSLREPARKAYADAARRALSLNASEAGYALALEALALTERDAPDRPELLFDA